MQPPPLDFSISDSDRISRNFLIHSNCRCIPSLYVNFVLSLQFFRWILTLIFCRLGGNNGILSSSVEALAPPKGFPAIKPTATLPLRRPPETITDTSQKQTLCSQCTENYERELAKLVAKEFEKSSSDSGPEAARPALPQWLQIATPSSTKPSPDQFKVCMHFASIDRE